MNLKAYRKWKAIQKKGLLHYVLTYGILLCGVPVGILLGILYNDMHTGFFVLRLFIIAGLGGIPFGLISWRVGEKKTRAFESTIEDVNASP